MRRFILFDTVLYDETLPFLAITTHVVLECLMRKIAKSFLCGCEIYIFEALGPVVVGV